MASASRRRPQWRQWSRQNPAVAFAYGRSNPRSVQPGSFYCIVVNARENKCNRTVFNATFLHHYLRRDVHTNYKVLTNLFPTITASSSLRRHLARTVSEQPQRQYGAMGYHTMLYWLLLHYQWRLLPLMPRGWALNSFGTIKHSMPCRFIKRISLEDVLCGTRISQVQRNYGCSGELCQGFNRCFFVWAYVCF